MGRAEGGGGGKTNHIEQIPSRDPENHTSWNKICISFRVLYPGDMAGGGGPWRDRGPEKRDLGRGEKHIHEGQM